MSEESTTTIKFGPGYEAPWFVAKGTVEDQKAELAEAFGLQSVDKTLAELVADASVVATALLRASVKATSEGYRPETTITAPQAPPPTVAEPDENVGEFGLASLIEAARSAEELNELYAKNKHLWTAQLTDLAKAKKEELKK